MYHLKLTPANLELEVAPGVPLQDVLFAQGVEFPCGGKGRCKGCCVKVLHGALPASNEEKYLLTIDELAVGWRLSCRHSVTTDLELELAQWEMAVLSDHSTFPFKPRDGLGIAIDLGTTTIAAQLVDLQTGGVLAVRTAVNSQARHGADVMSRIEFARRGGQAELQQLVRSQLGVMVTQLLDAACSQASGRKRSPLHAVARASSRDKGKTSRPAFQEQLRRVSLVGNTVMHHLFCGVSVEPLAGHPFEPKQPGRFQFSPRELSWDLSPKTIVEFLPCLGGFVGSDVLAGIAATNLGESRDLTALLDLGTNGEIVVGNREQILCTSTAAGPAFEGARISMGMRAATGAICEVRVEDNGLACRVIGGGAPRGLCGSGLVDAVAAGLELGWIQPSGRMTVMPAMRLMDSVTLLQSDVRELQLAKGAVAAGLRLLMAKLGASLQDLRQLHLAGAFGNYINRSNAGRIGLLRLPLDRVTPAGNTALHGAKLALFEDAARWDAIRSRVEHVALNEEPGFYDTFAEEMQFPV